MCGIAGILSFDQDPARIGILERMTSALSHRGPDGQGIEWIGPAGLGHRRLSIIDLEAGKQPLCNEDGTVWITFNGEIYNYQTLRERLLGLGHVFRTQSDTEVIVHAYEQWGAKCVEELRGMFAFAIWDSRNQKLTLARDRFGIKPLVYGKSKTGLGFSSEIQSLKKLPGLNLDIDLGAIDQFLHYQYIPAPRSIFRGIQKLEPACYIQFDLVGRTTGPVRYWRPTFHEDRTKSDKEWLEILDEALEETVRAHLVSDVPFGAFLSGGIDSSTVVAYMRRVLPSRIRTFCIGHSDSKFDEREWAREAAETLDVDFIEEVIELNSLEILPKLLHHYGEPFADSSAIATYAVAGLAVKHVKMALSGDGGDELFAGYYAYPATLWEHRRPSQFAPRVKNQVANSLRSIGLLKKRPSLVDTKYERTAVWGHTQRMELWRPEHQHFVEETRADFGDRFQRAHQDAPLNQLQGFDIETYIPFDNLTKVDIATMLHGLEVRTPLIDHVFLERTSGIPTELKLPGIDAVGSFSKTPNEIELKRMLKENGSRFFRKEFLHRSKQGFEIPIQSWFEQDPTLTESLLHSSLLHDCFDSSELAKSINDGKQTKLGSWRLWSLFVIGKWSEALYQPK